MLTIRYCTNLPPLSWVADFTPKRNRVLCGDMVECGEDWISEGAWAGSFSPHAAIASGFRCCTGFLIATSTITAFAPSHSLEFLYLFCSMDRLIIANSLAAIIAYYPEASFKPNQLDSTKSAMCSIRQGTVKYRRILFKNDCGTMYRLAFSVFDISLQENNFGTIWERHLVTPGSGFRDYSAYRNNISVTLTSLWKNASNRHRRQPFRKVLTSCSSGYDSVATTVFAKELGATEIVTLTTGRGGGSDSGAPIAAALGLRCYEFPRLGHGQEKRIADDQNFTLKIDRQWILDSMTDRTILASLTTSEDSVYSAFAPHLPKSLFLTGFHGDKVWDIDCSSGPHIKRGDDGGSGIDEFRKKVGFINVPVPFIGVEFYEDIARIASSEELIPYQVPGKYNRPIPRRIAEEGGVPRSLFGNKKHAASLLLRLDPALKYELFSELVGQYRSVLSKPEN